MKKLPLFFTILLFPFFAFTQNEINFYPTHWWAGMKWNKLQIMVHGKKVADNFPMIKMGPDGVKLATGVKLTKINRVENPNYIFLDISIDATARPGKFSFPFLKNMELSYELKSRRPGNSSSFAQGVTSKDFMYLIMPDRFSNGDESIA